MPLFRRLINSSGNVNELEQFIARNIQSFNTLHASRLKLLNEEKADIREFIETKRLLLEELDFSSSTNRSFISILFDFAERFGFLSIVAIENTLIRRELYLGERRQAAKLFLLNIRNNNDYIDRFEKICNLLQTAYLTEEDSDINIIATFLNYATKILRDTSEKYVYLLKESVKRAQKSGQFDFLHHFAIEHLLEIDEADSSVGCLQVQELIDEILGRSIKIEPPELPSDLFIEDNTEYSARLENERISLVTLREIAVGKCRLSGSELNGRGVLPLGSEAELYIYLYRYGFMHGAKLNVCFETIPFHDINTIVEIIDWGCGQGLASIVLNDYLTKNDISLNMGFVTLIEPSILSLQRAALHVSLAINPPNIRTVCKSFDSLNPNDVYTNEDSIKIHLFSNVLDIGEAFYSQSALINLVRHTQRGINYFICASPYIDDFKTNRIENFVNNFSDCVNFELISKNDKRKGEWINSWTKAIRVFKVKL